MRISRPLLLSMLALLSVGSALADDSVRAAQETLKNLGYYTGPTDGELNADTKGALRRFQIRNGLTVTSAADAETLDALNKEAKEAKEAAPAAPTLESVPTPPTPPTPPAPAAPQTPPAPAVPPAPAQPAESDAEIYRSPARPPVPPAAAVPPAPSQPAGSDTSGYAHLFARTPYRNAPLEVQRDTLRRAQVILARQGYYEGDLNGQPGPDMEEALLRFQSARHLPRTGVLDIDTLAEMRLLPVTKLSPRPHGVYKGRIPGAPPEGEVPVRGIPVD